MYHPQGLKCRAQPRKMHAYLPSLLLLASLQPGAWAETAIVDGVPHVRNGVAPRDGVRTLELEELWRVGGEDDDIFFGLVTRVRADERGNLYVMDGQLSEVHVYDPDGARLRTLFGEGEGPGEIRGPRDLILLDDGRVGALQEMPGKLIFVERDGRPAGSMRVGGEGTSHGGFCQTFGAFARGDLVALSGFVQSPGEEPGTLLQTNFLARFDETGRQRARYCERSNLIVFDAFVFDELKHLAGFWWNADIGADQHVYAAPYLDRYEVHVFDPIGPLVRVIERAYDPVRRTPAECQEFTDYVKAIYANAPVEVEVKPSDFEPVILYMQRGLRVHADGTLWVLTSRGVREQAAGVLATFDVFDPAGVFIRQVSVRVPGDGRNDGIFFVAPDRAVVVKGYTDAMVAQFAGGTRLDDGAGEGAALMEVIVYRVR